MLDKSESAADQIADMIIFRDWLEDYREFAEALGFRLERDRRGALQYIDQDRTQLRMDQIGKLYHLMWQHSINEREDLLSTLINRLHGHKVEEYGEIIKKFVNEEQNFIQEQRKRMNK